MEVALIIERMETWRGGAETSTMQFAQHLAQDGCQVSVLTTTHMPSTPELNIIPLKASRLFRTARTAWFSRRAAEYVQAHRFDVVHCITPCLAADIYQPRGGTVPEMLARNVAIRTSAAGRAAKRFGQAINLKFRVLSKLERDLLRRTPSPWVIAISGYVADQLHRHYRFDSNRIARIFNGIDPDTSTAHERQVDRTQIRRQYGIAPDELVALCVAHNFKLKGVARFIEALARPEARLFKGVIVGRDDPGVYVQLAEQLGVKDRIMFVGSTTRIATFFHAADVLVHPTYYDPCSRVVLEAMASGLPAITTDYNGAAERITNGVTGYTIDSPENVAALAECLGRLTDAAHRQGCANNAPAAVAECTMQNHARQVKALYERLVAERNQSPHHPRRA